MTKYLAFLAMLVMLSGCYYYPYTDYDYDNYYYHHRHHDRDDYYHRDRDDYYRYNRYSDNRKTHYDISSADNGTAVALNHDKEARNRQNGR
jgi:hypothetical protein